MDVTKFQSHIALIPQLHTENRSIIGKKMDVFGDNTAPFVDQSIMQFLSQCVVICLNDGLTLLPVVSSYYSLHNNTTFPTDFCTWGGGGEVIDVLPLSNHLL